MLIDSTDRNGGPTRFAGFDYDVIVVGARIAGTATAIPLRRRGLKVLVVDLAHFPSDKMSTHLLLPAGVDVMKRLGSLDRLLDAGAYLYHQDRMVTPWFDYMGACRGPDGTHMPGFGLTRYVLDKVMVDYARDEGVPVIEGFKVTDLLFEKGWVRGIKGHARKGSGSMTLTAPLVIGADGLRSTVTRLAREGLGEGVFERSDIPCLRTCYYMVAPNVDYPELHETSILGGGTNGYLIVHLEDGTTMLCIGFHPDEMEQFRADRYGHFLKTLADFDITRPIVERNEADIRATRMHGSCVMQNTIHDPVANGCVLVGDSSITIDPIVGQGMSFALISTEILTQELARCFEEGTLDAFSADSLQPYKARRDKRLLPVFNFTVDISITAGLPKEYIQLARIAEKDRRVGDEIISFISMVIDPKDFPSEHLSKKMTQVFLKNRPALSEWRGRPASPDEEVIADL